MNGDGRDGRPLVGLTIGRDLPGAPGYLRIRRTYPDAVLSAGGVPVLVPPMDDEGALRRLFHTLNALVLPGGLDVEPHHFQQQPHPSAQADPTLDRLELKVARWAAEDGLPTLGICRGQQVLNVALGGSLIQDLPSEDYRHPRSQQRTDLVHPVRVEEGSRLAHILGTTGLQVNSFHHQAVRDVAPGLKATAWSPEGVIEGLESTGHRFLLAVQFHPEDLVGFHEPSRRLFRALIEACSGEIEARAGASLV